MNGKKFAYYIYEYHEDCESQSQTPIAIAMAEEKACEIARLNRLKKQGVQEDKLHINSNEAYQIIQNIDDKATLDILEEMERGTLSSDIDLEVFDNMFSKKFDSYPSDVVLANRNAYSDTDYDYKGTYVEKIEIYG